MKKLLLFTFLLSLCLAGFGQYSSSGSGESQVFVGIIGLITIVTIWVIAARIKKLIDSNRKLIKIQTLVAISFGAVKKRECVKCGDIHAPDFLDIKGICPKCGIKYDKNHVILKVNNVIGNYNYDFYNKNKDKEHIELLWPNKNE
jgi:hypothetical protein